MFVYCIYKHFKVWILHWLIIPTRDKQSETLKQIREIRIDESMLLFNDLASNLGPVIQRCSAKDKKE